MKSKEVVLVVKIDAEALRKFKQVLAMSEASKALRSDRRT